MLLHSICTILIVPSLILSLTLPQLENNFPTSEPKRSAVLVSKGNWSNDSSTLPCERNTPKACSLRVHLKSMIGKSMETLDTDLTKNWSWIPWSHRTRGVPTCIAAWGWNSSPNTKAIRLTRPTSPLEKCRRIGNHPHKTCHFHTWYLLISLDISCEMVLPNDATILRRCTNSLVRPQVCSLKGLDALLRRKCYIFCPLKIHRFRGKISMFLPSQSMPTSFRDI